MPRKPKAAIPATNSEASTTVIEVPPGTIPADPTPATYEGTEIPRVHTEIPDGPAMDIPVSTPSAGKLAPPPMVPRGRGPQTPSQTGIREGSRMDKAQDGHKTRLQERAEQMALQIQGLSGVTRNPQLEAKYPSLFWTGTHYSWKGERRCAAFDDYRRDIGELPCNKRLKKFSPNLLWDGKYRWNGPTDTKAYAEYLQLYGDI